MAQLLITIVLVAVLVILSVGGMQSAKTQSRRIGCISKLRAMGAACGAYAADHKGQWPYYRLDNDQTTQPHETWSTSGAYVYGTWLGVGLLYPYLDGKIAYICPADPTITKGYQAVNWDTPVQSLWGSYVARGLSATYRPSQGKNSLNPLGKLRADVSARSIISCYFMALPTNLKRYPLSYHNEQYPVLFGNGSVVLRPLPQTINPKSPPNIYGTTSHQIMIWDGFDGIVY